MDFSANWMYVFAIIGGLVAAWRIWQNLQKLRQRQNDSWDARLIDQLRKRGSDPFKPHDVDFFLAFPDSEGGGAPGRAVAQRRLRCRRARLARERRPALQPARAQVHAAHRARHAGPEPPPHRRGRGHGGRYDGWSAKQVPRTDLPVQSLATSSWSASSRLRPPP